MNRKTYKVRGYWHSNGSPYEGTFAESGAPSKDITIVMPRQELLDFLNKYEQRSFYIDSENTYKKSFSILQVAKDYD